MSLKLVYYILYYNGRGLMKSCPPHFVE